MFKNKIKILKLPPLKNTLIFFSRVCLNPDSPKKVFSVTFVSVLSDTSSQTHTMNRRTRHPKWLTELNEKLNDLQSSFKYQFTHGKMAVCPAGRWWFGCLDTLPETLRSRLGVTSEAGTLEDAYVGYNVIQAVKESASETPGNRVWYFALTSVSADDEEEFPFLISRFTGNLSDVGEVKNWFVGLPLDKLPKQWNTFSEFETFGKAEDIQHDFYPECSGSLISGDRDVEGRLPECFSLKKVGTDEEFQVFECPDPLSGRDSDSDYSDSESESELTVDNFVGDPIVFFTALFDAFIQNNVGFRDDTSLSCDTTLFRMVADIEQKLNKILDENETPFPMIPICVTVNNKKFLVELYKERKVAVPEGELKWASFEHDPFSNGEPVEENCLFTSGLFADIKMCFNSAFEIEHIFVVLCSFYNIEEASLPTGVPSLREFPVYAYLTQSLETLGYFEENRFLPRGSLQFTDGEPRLTLKNDDVPPIPPKIMDAQERLNHYRTSTSDINNTLDGVRNSCVEEETTHDPTYFRDLANRQTLTGQRQFNPDTVGGMLAEFIQNPENWQQQPNSNPRRNSSLEVGNNDSSEDSDSEEDPLTFR